MRWQVWISKPWLTLVGWVLAVIQAVIGWPGTVDDAANWDRVEMSILTLVLFQLATAILAAHIAVVVMRKGEPYRAWLQRGASFFGFVMVECITFDRAWRVLKYQRQYVREGRQTGYDLWVPFDAGNQPKALRVRFRVSDSYGLEFAESPDTLGRIGPEGFAIESSVRTGEVTVYTLGMVGMGMVLVTPRRNSAKWQPLEPIGKQREIFPYEEIVGGCQSDATPPFVPRL